MNPQDIQYCKIHSVSVMKCLLSPIIVQAIMLMTEVQVDSRRAPSLWATVRELHCLDAEMRANWAQHRIDRNLEPVFPVADR